VMESDGAYVRRQPGDGKKPLSSQAWFLKRIRTGS